MTSPARLPSFAIRASADFLSLGHDGRVLVCDARRSVMPRIFLLHNVAPQRRSTWSIQKLDAGREINICRLGSVSRRALRKRKLAGGTSCSIPGAALVLR